LEQISPSEAVDILDPRTGRESAPAINGRGNGFGKDGTSLDVDVTPDHHHAFSSLIRSDEEAAWDDLATDA
jgi:hypothetical protein